MISLSAAAFVAAADTGTLGKQGNELRMRFLSIIVGTLLLTTPLHAADRLEHVDAAAASGQVVTVHIDKMKYDPKELVIAKGTTVIWTNDDAMPHNVHFGKGDPKNEVKGDMLRAGQSYALKFNEAGEFPYICTPHPFMKATVKVE